MRTSTARPRSWPAVLWAFARPHTIIGTVVSITTLWVLAVDAAGRVGGVDVLVLALLGGLATNVFIVGLNQVTDVDIDRVNKPWLPIAAGDLRMDEARRIVVGSALAATACGLAGGVWLLGAFVVGMLVGGAYSLPPVRLKRRPAWAAAAISFVRGVVVNVGVYAQMAAATSGAASVPARVVVLSVAVVVFGLVIAWLKDVPDLEGDRRHGVRTLALRLGGRRVMVLGLAGLTVCQVGLAVAGLVGVPGLHGGVLAAGCALLLAAVAAAASRVQLTEVGSFARFYLRVWGAFYAQYAVVAVAALAA